MRVFRKMAEPNPKGLIISDDGVIIDIRHSPGLVSYEADGILYMIPHGDPGRYEGKRAIPLDIYRAYRPGAYGKMLPKELLARMRADLVDAYAAVGKACVFPWGKPSPRRPLPILICLIIAVVLEPFSLGWSFFLNTRGGPFGDFAGPTLLFFLVSLAALLAGVLVLVLGRSRWRWWLLLLVLPNAVNLLYHLGDVMLRP